MSEKFMSQTNWVKALADTYDECVRQEGLLGRIDVRTVVTKDERVLEFVQRPLLPMYHDLRMADLVCEITKNGDFVKMYKVTEAKDRMTIVPVTSKSMARTSSPFPHGLAELVTIIQGDMVPLPEKDANETQLPADASDYLKQMDRWIHSKSFMESPKWDQTGVLAVYRYVRKGRLMEDLAKTFEDPKEFDAMREVLMKWFVVDLDEEEGNPDLSQNANMWRLWERFYRETEKQEEDGFCYATGIRGPIMKMAPKGLTRQGNKGKIFPVCATNMTPGTGIMTFRGPFFSEPEDACTINRDVSEKVHAMLRWLIDRQSWALSTKSLYPRVIVWDPTHPEHSIDVNVLFGKDPVSEYDPDMFVVDDSTGEIIGRKNEQGEVTRVNILRLASGGYVVEGLLDSVKNLVIMTIDSSGDDAARIAITGFSAMTADDYIQKLIYWHETTKHGRFEKGLTCRDILNLIVDVKGKQADVIKNYYTKFIVNSINTGRPLPEDIIRLAFSRCFNTVSYQQENGESVDSMLRRYSYNLDAACALIRKRAIDLNNGGCENYMNTLDENYTGRDYLYGRALACFDTIERRAQYSKKNSIERPTNAWRMMPRFFQQPATTTAHLMMVVNPYMDSNDRWKKSQYIMRTMNRILAEIAEQTTPGADKSEDAPLGYEALLGYHWQMNAFSNFRKNDPESGAEGDEADDSESAADDE